MFAMPRPPLTCPSPDRAHRDGIHAFRRGTCRASGLAVVFGGLAAFLAGVPIAHAADAAVPRVKLERHFDISKFGSEIMAAGDIDGDGATELVFYQGPGMLSAAVFQPGAPGPYGKHTTPADQALDCLTAIDVQGRVLWQRGRPWAASIPFRTHGGDGMLLVADIDGDDRPELLRIRGKALEVVDGATGAPRQTTALDDEGYSQLVVANFKGGRARQILVRPVSDGLDGHPHGCPNVVFDENLKPFWPRRDFTRAGHVPKPHDVDGDGKDELLVGLDCANPDGSVRWTLAVPGGEANPAAYFLGHDDRRTIADLDGDGKLEQVLALENLGLVVSDLAGKVLWRHPVPDHCGEACVGRFLADVPGLQIMINNERFGMKPDPTCMGTEMLDAHGKSLWTSPEDRYALPIDWPNAAGPQAMLARPHREKLDDYRPFIMDGRGRKLAVFDIPASPPQVTDYTMPHANLWWGDWGDYYSYRVVDFAGVGTRILIWTRRDLWIFQPVVEPAAAQEPQPGFAAAYRELLGLFPVEHAGRGIDRGGEPGVVADHPMTYGLVLSAESLRVRADPDDEGRRRIRAAARWLADNSRLSADRKPGWGVPYDWGDRPRNASYTITTAVVLEGLLDALEADVGWTAAETAEIVELARAVGERWCTDLWMDGQGGGYFCYCDHDAKPCGFYVNAPAMLLGSLARLLHEHGPAIPAEQRALFQSRCDSLARAAVATVVIRDGAPYWDYITPPYNPNNFQRPNDLIHQAYILWGLETYRDLGGTVSLPWTRAKAVESLDRFWKDGTIRFFAQDEATVKPGNREAPTNLWGAGMLLACYGRWGSIEQSRRCFDAILATHGPFPRMRVLPAAVSDDDRTYPRDNAHVLFGLAWAIRQARDGQPPRTDDGSP